MQIVYSAEQLDDLKRQWRTLPSVRHLPEYILDIPELTGRQNDAISLRINHNKQTCGCRAARACVIVACLALLLEHMAGGRFFAGLGFGLLAIDAAIVISAFFIGKLTAMAYARARLIRLAASTVQNSLQVRRVGA